MARAVAMFIARFLVSEPDSSLGTEGPEGAAMLLRRMPSEEESNKRKMSPLA
jgi:hypothetical protein